MLEIAFTILSFVATLALITVLLERRDMVNAVITFSLGALLFGIPIFISMGVTYTLLIMTMGGMLIAYATNTVINRLKARAYAPLTEAQRRVRELREQKRSDGPVIEGFRLVAKTVGLAVRGVQRVGRAAGIEPRSHATGSRPAPRGPARAGAGEGSRWTGDVGAMDGSQAHRVGAQSAGGRSVGARSEGARSEGARSEGDGSSMALARTLLRRDAATRKKRVESVNAAVQAMPNTGRHREQPFQLPEPDPVAALLPGERRPPPLESPPKPAPKSKPDAGRDTPQTVVKRFARRPGGSSGVDGETIQSFTDLSRKAGTTGRYRPHLSRLAARKR